MPYIDVDEMQLEETEQDDQHVDEVDEEWNQDTGKKRRLSSPLQGCSRTLRNTDASIQEAGTGDKFPEIPLRVSFETFNPALLELLARLECKWRLPARVSREVFVDISNNYYKQNYIIRCTIWCLNKVTDFWGTHKSKYVFSLSLSLFLSLIYSL